MILFMDPCNWDENLGLKVFVFWKSFWTILSFVLRTNANRLGKINNNMYES